MPCDLKALIGSPVEASDGEIGSVRNFLFDDQPWKVRYVVVEVGRWLKRRDVVLPITVLEKPEWANKTCRTHLTKDQVRNSPDVDAEMSVSRQEEIAMRDYFGPLATWADSELGMPPMPAGMKYPLHTAEVLHLRSTSNMLGYQVWATDGEFGIFESYVMDEASWHLGYLDVKSGDWLQNRSALVPTRWGTVRLLDRILHSFASHEGRDIGQMPTLSHQAFDLWPSAIAARALGLFKHRARRDGRIRTGLRWNEGHTVIRHPRRRCRKTEGTE